MEVESQKYCCTFKPNEVLYFSVEHKENILNLKVGQLLTSGGIVLEMANDQNFIKRPLKVFYNGEIVYWYKYLEIRTFEAYEYFKKNHKPAELAIVSHILHLAERICIIAMHGSKCKFVNAPFCGCEGMDAFIDQIKHCRNLYGISENECEKIFSFYHMHYEQMGGWY